MRLRTSPPIVFLAFFLSSTMLPAMPEFLERYSSDRFASPNWRGQCATCHINPDGSGPRNAFGQAFDAAGKMIGPLLRAQFPDRFTHPQQQIDASTRVHYSDPDRQLVVVQREAKFIIVDASKPPDTTIAAPTPMAAVAIQSDSAERRRHLHLANRVLNLPGLNPLPRGGVEVNISHRFTDPAFKGNADRLFGLDSTANISFGADVGLTDRIRAGLSRSRFSQNIELTGLVRLLAQDENWPLSLGVRAGIEGRENFHDRYSGSLQIIAARSFADRLQAYFVPTFVFNARDSLPEFTRRFGVGGRNSNHTIALGLAADLSVLPTVSLLAEWVPRVEGWMGAFEDKSTVSFGIKKSTNRHAFVLTLSKSVDLTPTGYAVNSPEGSFGFRLGFNIYRRIR